MGTPWEGCHIFPLEEDDLGKVLVGKKMGEQMLICEGSISGKNVDHGGVNTRG